MHGGIELVRPENAAVEPMHEGNEARRDRNEDARRLEVVSEKDGERPRVRQSAKKSDARPSPKKR
jgi:hypothetical protein